MPAPMATNCFEWITHRLPAAARATCSSMSRAACSPVRARISLFQVWHARCQRCGFRRVGDASGRVRDSDVDCAPPRFRVGWPDSARPHWRGQDPLPPSVRLISCENEKSPRHCAGGFLFGFARSQFIRVTAHFSRTKRLLSRNTQACGRRVRCCNLFNGAGVHRANAVIRFASTGGRVTF
jgi:hypothetical protein